MFCRKCGCKLIDNSFFCHNCGERVIQSGEVNGDDCNVFVPSESNYTLDTSNPKSLYVPDPSCYPDEKTHRSPLKVIIPVAVFVFLLICIVGPIISASLFSAREKNQCEHSGCNNDKVEGGRYCYSHTCTVSGCYDYKTESGYYCYSHKCLERSCDNRRVEGGKYCKKHTCSTPGCFEEIVAGTSNCYEHQVDMRERLTSSSFGFTLDSAGGIDFRFAATNSSGKTINYVRFNVYLKNRVGDEIKDDIRGKNYCEVEIIGPFNRGDKINYSEDNIGYCDDLYRIDIKDITLVYSDGTEEIGKFNYYAEKH